MATYQPNKTREVTNLLAANAQRPLSRDQSTSARTAGNATSANAAEATKRTNDNAEAAPSSDKSSSKERQENPGNSGTKNTELLWFNPEFRQEDNEGSTDICQFCAKYLTPSQIAWRLLTGKAICRSCGSIISVDPNCSHLQLTHGDIGMKESKFCRLKIRWIEVIVMFVCVSIVTGISVAFLVIMHQTGIDMKRNFRDSDTLFGDAAVFYGYRHMTLMMNHSSMN